MGKDTVEAWCIPVDIPGFGKYADHVFIYCPDKDKSFSCWGGLDRNAPDSVLVCGGNGNKAYCKASKYRGPFDSACLGVYGVNGVCHQTANLFLYATDNTCLPLNREKPRGVIATHALFGVYGAATPGNLPGCSPFFATWVSEVYLQTKAGCLLDSRFGLNSNLAANQSNIDENSLAQKIQRIYEQDGCFESGGAETGTKENNEYLTQEMSVILNHYLQNAGDNLIADVHYQILTEKDYLMIQYGITHENIKSKSKLPQNQDVVELMEKLNELSVQFQSELAAKLGKDDYFRLTHETQYYRPINPKIARKVFAEL